MTHLTPDMFRARLAELGLTQGKFARLTGIHPVTVNQWGSTRSGRVQEVPRWVGLLLQAWEVIGEAPATVGIPTNSKDSDRDETDCEAADSGGDEGGIEADQDAAGGDAATARSSGCATVD